MRMKPAADDLLERLAIRLNLAPMPGAYAMYGMVVGRVIGVAKRLGIFDALLDGPATAQALAEHLGLQPAGTRLLCENLVGVEILDQQGDTFTLTSRAR